MALKINQTKKDKIWTSVLIEESEENSKHRKHMFQRMYTRVFVLGIVGFVFYCGLFYVGAFFDAGKIVNFSQSVRVQKAQRDISSMQHVKKRTLFSPIIERFSTNRLYMRKGQTIFATYSLPKNAELSLKIKQCESQLVLEVFQCKVLREQSTVIRDRSTGFVEFTISKSGFYYFEGQATKLPKTKLKAYFDYRISWRRNGKGVRVSKKSQSPQLR